MLNIDLMDLQNYCIVRSMYIRWSVSFDSNYLSKVFSSACNITKEFDNNWLLHIDQNDWQHSLNFYGESVPFELVDFIFRYFEPCGIPFTKLGCSEDWNHRRNSTKGQFQQNRQIHCVRLQKQTKKRIEFNVQIDSNYWKMKYYTISISIINRTMHKQTVVPKKIAVKITSNRLVTSPIILET